MTSGARRLELRNIEKRFGGVHALRGANFSVALDTGVIHGLLGENGSGKSTLLGVLSGQLRPDAGSIELDAVTLATLDAVRPARQQAG